MVSNLINYLPEYMKKYAEIQQIMNTETVEVESLWTAIIDVWKNQFLFDATEDGVKRWESLLEIVPKLTDTLDERKYRIFSLMNQDLPYTMTRLMLTLDTLCSGDYEITPDFANYHIEVLIGLANKSNYDDVEDLVTKMIPANLTHVIRIRYNTHEVLSEFTHGDLVSYTHAEIREEVLT